MTDPAPIRPQDIELPPTQPLDISYLIINLAKPEPPAPTT